MGVVSASLFFRQLTQFSERIFRLLKIGVTETPWTSGRFRENEPSGAIIHYTAGTSASSTLRWFMDAKHESKASAHVVIADCWPDVWRQLAEGLPMVQDLPTAVVQCLHPSRIAWHAGRANARCYGLELVNVGEVREHGDGWVYWPNDWLEPWVSHKHPVYLYGVYWEPYPFKQIISTIQVLRYLRHFVPRLEMGSILGHSQVTRNKIDPGPVFPLHEVRSAAQEDLDPMLYQWAERYVSLGRRYMELSREAFVLQWFDRFVSFASGEERVELAWKCLKRALSDLVDRDEFGATGKAGLRILGFQTSSWSNDHFTDVDQQAVCYLQELMGLVADGIPRSATKAALLERIRELGYWPGD